MLYTTNPVIKHKAGLLSLAEKLSNVSKACKIMDVSASGSIKRHLTSFIRVSAQLVPSAKISADWR